MDNIETHKWKRVEIWDIDLLNLYIDYGYMVSQIDTSNGVIWLKKFIGKVVPYDAQDDPSNHT